MSKTRYTVSATFGSHWTVYLDGKPLDHYSSAALAQAYADYMNGRGS